MSINILEIFMVVAVVEFLLFSNKKVVNYLNHHPILIWPFDKLKEKHLSALKASTIFCLVGLVWFDVFVRLLSRYSYNLYSSITSLASKFHNSTLLYLSQNYLFLAFGIIMAILGLGFFIFPLVILSKLLKEELYRPKVKV